MNWMRTENFALLWPILAKILRIYALFTALFFIMRYFIHLVLKRFSKIFQSTLWTQVPSPRSRCLTLHRLTALNGYYQATAAPLAETPPSAQNRSNGAQKWAETLQAPPFRHYPPNVFSLDSWKCAKMFAKLKVSPFYKFSINCSFTKKASTTNQIVGLLLADGFCAFLFLFFLFRICFNFQWPQLQDLTKWQTWWWKNWIADVLRKPPSSEISQHKFLP